MLGNAVVTSCVHRHVDAERSARQGLARLHCSAGRLLRLNRRRHLWQHRQAGAAPGQGPACDAMRGAVRLACSLRRWNGGLPPGGRFRWGSSHSSAWWCTCIYSHQISAPHARLTHIPFSCSLLIRFLNKLGVSDPLVAQCHKGQRLTGCSHEPSLLTV